MIVGAIKKEDIIVNQLSNDKKKWFAVYTKYKCEKYVSESLSKKQVEAYVPIIKRSRRYNRKVKHYDIPLINCYVFVHIDKKDYIPTLETEYVMKFLKQGRDLLAIPDYEIEVLKRVSGDIIDVVSMTESAFSEGELVEVMSGHLAGMRGKIVSKLGKHNFMIDLETIGYQLRINVDPGLLRVISRSYIMA